MRLFCGFLGAAVGMTLAFLLAGTNTIAVGLFAIFSLPLGFLLGLIGGIVGGRRFAAFWQSEATKRQRALVVSALTLVPLLLLGGMAAMVYQNGLPPSDSRMIAHFQQHKPEFEQLAQMVQENPGLERVDENWTSPENPQSIGVSAARLATYRKLLKQAGVPRGFWHGERNGKDGPIYFGYWLWGSAVSSDRTKGFAYCTKPPKPLVKSLDSEKYDDAYHHIEGNWYLFYEYIPG
jgi:hypothetical protein